MGSATTPAWEPRLTLTSTVRSKSASGDVLGRVGGAEARVVHQDVEPAEPADGGVDRRADLVQVADVHREAQHAAAHALDLVGEVGAGRRSRSPRATSAPACASASAIALPSPRAAPVTSAVRPSRSKRGKSFTTAALLSTSEA